MTHPQLHDVARPLKNHAWQHVPPLTAKNHDRVVSRGLMKNMKNLHSDQSWIQALCCWPKFITSAPACRNSLNHQLGHGLQPQDLRRYVDEPRYEEDFPHSNIRYPKYPKYPCLWDAFLSHQSAHDSAHMPGPRPSSLPRPSLMISEWLGVQHGSILRVQFQVSLCCENHEMVLQFVLLSWLISREIP